MPRSAQISSSWLPSSKFASALRCLILSFQRIAVFICIVVVTYFFGMSTAEASNKSSLGLARKTADFKQVELIGDGFGWAADDHSLWKTENSGRTWKRIRPAARERVGDWLGDDREEANFIDRIQPLNRYRGWILEGGELLRTTDGGRRWKKFRRGRLDIRSFRFVNESNGFFVAQHLHYGQQIDYWRAAEIYRTTDGGMSWSKVPVKRDLRWTWLLDLWPASATNIWAVGDVILNSRNGGKTWREVDVERGHGFYGRAVLVRFSNSKRGWIKGQGGFAVTRNGGNTWTPTGSVQKSAHLIRR